MKSSGDSLPDWLRLDLNALSADHRQVLYWNILFPGAGFVFAGDWTRSLLLGGGAMGFLLAGMGFGLNAVRPDWAGAGRFMVDLAPAAVCFVLVVVLHVIAILTSPRSRLRAPSRMRAVVYLTVCVLLAGFGILRFLLEVWRAML